jgi:steroid 5-alpha reductase family enzyme
MRAAAGARYPAFMLGFFLLQALIAIALSLPFFFLAQDPHPAWRLLDLTGLAIWLTGFGLEVIADAQLDRWRSVPSNAGRTCRAGLWSWSRHPNYFGEWLTWCGIALIAWPAPAGWTGAAAALLMLVLVRYVSGVPFTERQALRTRGEDYRSYQRTTSVFLPMPPRGVPQS